MGFNAQENLDRIKADRQAALYGRRYFYTTASDGHQIIGVLRGLGDAWIVGYFRETGSRRAIKAKTLWSTAYPDDLQQRLDAWAKKRNLREVA